MDRYYEYEESHRDYNNYNSDIVREKSNTALILGIISIVFIFLPGLNLIGFVLGIIAVIKGSRYRSRCGTAQAGWVLGILSIVFSSITVLLIMLIFGHLFLFPFLFMGLPMIWL